MSKFFISLYQAFFQKRILLFLILFLIIGVFCYRATKISFQENIAGFLPDNKENEQINYAYQNIGAANKMMVNFVCSDTSKTNQSLLMEAVDDFVACFQKVDTNGFTSEISYKIDQRQFLEITEFINNNLPYFLTESDYQHFDSLLTEEYISHVFNENKKLLLMPSGMVMKKMLLIDPLHLSAGVLKNLQSFQLNNDYQLIDDYIFSKDAKKAIVTITSSFPVSETAMNGLLVQSVNQVINEVEKHFENQVSIDLFGSAPIAVENATQIKRDSYISIGLSIVLILLILIYFFKNFKSIVLIFVPVVFGVLFSIAMLALLKDSVSIIAIGAGSIIIGIAVNYPLHFLVHYKYEKNIPQLLKDIVPPLTIGNITTVGAFLSLLFISSSSMHDLGLFAAFLLVGTILFVLIFLPHLFKNKPHSKKEIIGTTFKKLSNFSPEKNSYVVISVIVLTFFLYFMSSKATFETNMHKINYMTDSQRKQFEQVLKESDTTLHQLYFVAEGKTIDQALKEYENSVETVNLLKKSGNINKIAGIGRFLPSKIKQKECIDLWNSFKDKKAEFILNQIDIYSEKYGFKKNAFDEFKTMLQKDFEPHNLSYFSPIVDNLASNYLIDNENRAMVVTMLFVDRSKSESIMDELNNHSENTFAFDSQTITKKMISGLSSDFNYVLYICSFIVFAFLIFSFGRIEMALIAFFPLAISWIWILGIMGTFDIRFNIINIILATFIFGQGDDYAIFITEGLMFEYTYRKKMLASYKNAVVLSAVIVLIGIGSLIFAKHPAMRSLAEVTIIGMLSVLLMVYIFPPLFFKILTKKKGKNRLAPITLKKWFLTFISFTFFLLGSLYVTLAGFILLTIGRKSDKNKKRYHSILYNISRFIMRHLPLVKVSYKNQFNEKFDKPSVIISNHQSHIDLMCLMSLTPNLIILTNKWVWHSPFYGQIIRYADFLPIADGIETNIDKLSEMVDKGYSIVIFPEGTRSADCSIQRFHRGAFYLAEKLNLDIIPVMLHGVGFAVPKQELMIRKGQIHIEILDRIKPNDNSFGISYQERSKSMRQFYIKYYNDICKKVENADYYADLVIHNYIYKGYSIEKNARKMMKYYHNFTPIIEKIPNCKNILVLNCGQGEFALTCSLVYKEVNIKAFDTNKDNIALAENCISVPNNLQFTSEKSDANEYDFVIAFNPNKDQLEMIKEKDFIILVSKNIECQLDKIETTAFENFKLIRRQKDE